MRVVRVGGSGAGWASGVSAVGEGMVEITTVGIGKEATGKGGASVGVN